jgi:hypothetical protein
MIPINIWFDLQYNHAVHCQSDHWGCLTGTVGWSAPVISTVVSAPCAMNAQKELYVSSHNNGILTLWRSSLMESHAQIIRWWLVWNGKERRNIKYDPFIATLLACHSDKQCLLTHCFPIYLYLWLSQLHMAPMNPSLWGQGNMYGLCW